MESKLSNPIQDTIDTIDSLKKLNIPVALLTNNWFIEDGKDIYQIMGLSRVRRSEEDQR